MKISLYEFNALTDLDKTQVVLEHGTNLKTRKEEGFIVKPRCKATVPHPITLNTPESWPMIIAIELKSQ